MVVNVSIIFSLCQSGGEHGARVLQLPLRVLQGGAPLLHLQRVLPRGYAQEDTEEEEIAQPPGRSLYSFFFIDG